jgi:GPH family glycoside/pentoside/hexuronide:cation symporter
MCYKIVAFAIGMAVVASGIIAYWGTWERPLSASKVHPQYWEGLKCTLRNKPFLVLLSTFILMVIADNITLSQLIYVVEHFFGKKKEEIGSFMLVFFIGSLVSVPIWMNLGKRLGKKVCYIVSLLFYPLVFSCFGIYRWPDSFLYLFGVLGGFANAGLYMMPLALAPDIIEWDELVTHQRQEGLYMGVWIFTFKAGVGLGFVLVGIVLETIGYHGRQDISPSTLMGLRWSFALLPALFMFAAAAVFFLFPLSKEKHEEICRELEKRRG